MRARTYWTLLFCCLLGVSLPASKSTEDPAEVPKEIAISVLPGLRFDIPRFYVKPGQKVTIAFRNTDDMDHNLLILRPNSRQEIVNLATRMGTEGVTKQYVPESPLVLWHTPVLHAGEQETLTFTAPQQEGVYPYVCTLPGHGQVMYGAMYVGQKDHRPELDADTAIPPRQRQDESLEQDQKDHPYDLKAPYHYRLYIQGASPAAIAVHLPGNLSYCWDAGRCDLRFLWSGGFVDNTELWEGHKDAKAEIQGEIFYRQTVLPSLTIGSRNPPSHEIQFKGYRMIKDGYLEFHYQFGALDIYETLRETPEHNGIVRSFRIPGLKEDLTLHITPLPGMRCEYQGEVLTAGPLHLDAGSGKKFNVKYISDNL